MSENVVVPMSSRVESNDHGSICDFPGVTGVLCTLCIVRVGEDKGPVGEVLARSDE